VKDQDEGTEKLNEAWRVLMREAMGGEGLKELLDEARKRQEEELGRRWRLRRR